MTYKLRSLFASVIFICGITQAHADAVDDPMARVRLEASVAFDAKWLALKDKCKSPAASVSEDRLHSSWREANPSGLQQLDDIIVREQIRKGMGQAEARYPLKPPKAVCAMADELSSMKRADSSDATSKRGTGETFGTVYRCDADGTIVFSDIKYKSMPCKALDLPGYAPSEKARPAKVLSIAEAKQIAARNLLDPEATRFRDLFVSKSGNVCGELNSKNVYGAYTGYTQFFVHAATRRAQIDGGSKSAAVGFAYRESCAR